MRNVCLFIENDPASAPQNRQRLSSSPLRKRTMRIIPAALLAAAVLSRAAPNQELLSSYGKLPLAFEENRGQAQAGVSYLSRTRNGVVLLRPGGVALQSMDGKTTTHEFRGRRHGEGSREASRSCPASPATWWAMKAVGSAMFRIMPAVRYASVYPGIDAVFHGNQTDLEYDFVLSPGADPEPDPDRV